MRWVVSCDLLVKDEHGSRSGLVPEQLLYRPRRYVRRGCGRWPICPGQGLQEPAGHGAAVFLRRVARIRERCGGRRVQLSDSASRPSISSESDGLSAPELMSANIDV